MDPNKQAYRQEAYEILGDLEDGLIELEEHPEDTDTIGRVFRAMHTIKGSGAMFGFDDIAKFTHGIETVYSLVRENRLHVTSDMVSLTLKACDQIKAMLHASEGGEKADHGITSEISSEFEALAGSKPEKTEAAKEDQQPEDTRAEEKTYRIRFRPNRDIFDNGTNPILLLNELRGMGECSITAITGDLPDITEMDPEKCYCAWDIILSTDHDLNAIRDVFIFVEDLSEIDIAELDTQDTEKLGEILLSRGDVGRDDLYDALASQKKLGEVMVEKGTVKKPQIESALAEQTHIRKTDQKHHEKETMTSVRVPSERLDSLVNLVGELVILQEHLSQKTASIADQEVEALAEELERLTSRLRDNALGIRMLPIGTIFARFKRLVRDLSNEMGKEIVLETSGAQTELDKTVIENLGDPLTHLIRNCIDHGIEPPEERKAKGKNPAGTIALSAEHAGAHVLVKIMDDGKGLDTDAIMAKAVKQGIVSENASLGEQDIFRLIFAPGFSTAEKVTDVSGRGVGMDVVTKNIEKIGGKVELASKKDQGTTVTLKLPLTLAIINGFLVKIMEEFFIIPLSNVIECLELTEEDRSNHNRDIIGVRGEIMPYIQLRDVFSIQGKRPQIEYIVVVEVEGKRIGFVVDKIIGQRQIVIKNMGSMLKDTEGISGASIMGDGTVALILDTDKISAYTQKTQEIQ